MTIATKTTRHKASSTHQQWLPSDEQTMARFIAVKKQHHLKKGKSIVSFVLVRKKESNEFVDFLQTLQVNIKDIPANTRISLAVRTLFYDPSLDTKPDLWASTKQSPKHWTAVDLLIDPQGNLHSFVLDAANSVGYQGIYHELKTHFPHGKHYVFEEDHTMLDDGRTHTRCIQTQHRGCHIFTLNHLNILANIDTQTLYHHELPTLATKNPKKSGIIQPGDFDEEMRLMKIFASTQSFKTIHSLGFKHKCVKYKGGLNTLASVIDANTTTEDGISINETNYRKNLRYIQKQRLFYGFSRYKIKHALHDRKGELFLKNRGLINLNAALKHIETPERLLTFIESLHDYFIDELSDLNPRQKSCINTLKILSYSEVSSIDDRKYEFLLAVEDLLTEFSSNKKHEAMRIKCNRIIEMTLFISFQDCQVGIIHSNFKLLCDQNPNLNDFLSAIHSLATHEEIHQLVDAIQEKLGPMSFKKQDLWTNDLRQLSMFCSDPLIPIDALQRQLIFLMKTLFYRCHLLLDELNRNKLNKLIDDILEDCFEPVAATPAI